jgi:hypothetical protein
LKAVRKKYSPKVVLDLDWVSFSTTIPKMNEAELKAALEHETANRRRASYVARLHRKYNQVRYESERREYGVEGVKV